MATVLYNFTGLQSVYLQALASYDKSVAFDIKIDKGQFLLLMFLAEDDEKDTLFLYMRNIMVMRKLKMYGSHKKGDFKVYITDEVQAKMIEELQLQEGDGTFSFELFLNQMNQAIPLEIDMEQKVRTLRTNRKIIRTVGLDDIEKTVLIGTRELSVGKPQDKTLRKLYMYTEESEKEITDFIKNLKKANMTVAWTTEDQRFRAANINQLINGLR